MGSYTCLNCGYLFSEEEGLPSKQVAPNMNAMLQTGCGWHKLERAAVQGIAPGTMWEDIPKSFVCPSCGAGKELFEQW